MTAFMAIIRGASPHRGRNSGSPASARVRPIGHMVFGINRDYPFTHEETACVATIFRIPFIRGVRTTGNAQ